ncbi:SDR family oxidoreductase [Terasakiella sp. SH-1]|uniref:SDR family oxidoreductase n=1 Tax=Terasakiella sp. SH-1 TaxID=2560057 RepID=UPI001072FCE5|nr:SDR family oxidoreductase [Terasakiella sp. SH-1]
MKTLFIFGLGYCASHFARQAVEKGWRVIATSREAIRMDGVEIYPFDGEKPLENAAQHFADVTHILHSIPPHKETGDCVFHLHAQDLQELSNLQWIGYLSTTGVYGNADGALVNEDSPRNPSSARSHARKKAEDQWLASGLPIHIFRLAGIYGPGRSIFDQIRAGRLRAIDKPGHVFSRIHIDDIAAALWASIAKPNGPVAYNLCDDAACEPIRVLNYACELMGRERPKQQSFEEASQAMSPMALTFWRDNKRVDNTKIKNDLGFQLHHPSYREGLQAIWQKEKDHV